MDLQRVFRNGALLTPDLRHSPASAWLESARNPVDLPRCVLRADLEMFRMDATVLNSLAKAGHGSRFLSAPCQMPLETMPIRNRCRPQAVMSTNSWPLGPLAYCGRPHEGGEARQPSRQVFVLKGVSDTQYCQNVERD
jgi:hypothetical protein